MSKFPHTGGPGLGFPTYKWQIEFNISTGPSFSESDFLTMHLSWLQTNSVLDVSLCQDWGVISFSSLYASAQAITPSKKMPCPFKISFLVLQIRLKLPLPENLPLTTINFQFPMAREATSTQLGPVTPLGCISRTLGPTICLGKPPMLETTSPEDLANQ